MKKIISIVLLLALCLSVFAGCEEAPVETNPTGTTPPTTQSAPAGTGLEGAAEYLKAMYMSDDEVLRQDYSYISSIAWEGTTYTIEWTTDAPAEYVEIVSGETETTVKILNPKPTEDINYTVTGTLKDAEGNTATVKFRHSLPAVESADTANKPVFVTDVPVPGTAYKLVVDHLTIAKTLYFAGTTANKEYYLSTTEDITAATDVYVEEVEGGYQVYFMAEGDVKTYIDIYVSGTYINARLTTEPTAVYTWNADHKTFVATVDLNGTPAEAYLGAYGTYETFSASNSSYLGQDGSFSSTFCTVESKAVTATVVTDPQVDVAYKFMVDHLTIAKSLYFIGTTANKEYYFSTSDKATEGVDVYLEAVEGGYRLYFYAGDVKTYIDIYVSGTYINGRLTTEPTAVYTWNAEYNTLVATVDLGGTPTEAYLGAYGTYETFSASNASYLGQDGSFCANLVVVE